jgi:hypothetical protein
MAQHASFSRNHADNRLSPWLHLHRLNARIYQKYDFGAEKREALSVWAAHVATLQAPEGCRSPRNDTLERAP